jgi:uncharacterized protein (DUF1697 family)
MSMPRYIAFLRGVSPMNARMPALKACFEDAGFTEVRTLLSSGNVVFNARSTNLATLERRAEKAMQTGLARSFVTIVRPAGQMQRFVESEPFAPYPLGPTDKPVVAFLREPVEGAFGLPIERGSARIFKCTGTEVLCSYVPGPAGSVLMGLLERTFGTCLTTRTLDTVRKCAWA